MRVPAIEFARGNTACPNLIALVAQDDSLLQGTIAENISGFDEQIDMGRVRECAAHAQIDVPPLLSSGRVSSLTPAWSLL